VQRDPDDISLMHDEGRWLERVPSSSDAEFMVRGLLNGHSRPIEQAGGKYACAE